MLKICSEAFLAPPPMAVSYRMARKWFISFRGLVTKSRHVALRNQVFRMMSTQQNESDDGVLFEKSGCAGVITLNRPKALNSLDMDIVRSMYKQLEAWETDPNINAIIIKGAGGKAFCAGGDIKAVAVSGQSNGVVHREFFSDEYKLNYAIANLKTPYIALIDGVTMGGGVGVSVYGKARVATEDTLFAMPETAIGFFPDVGGGYFLSNLEGSLGVFLALTGHRLRGNDVVKAGIATHFVKKAKLNDLENEIKSLNKPSFSSIKGVLQSYHSQSKDTEDTPFSLDPHMSEINRIFSLPTIEAIMDELIRIDSEWSMKVLKTLEKMSPVSLKITLRLMKEGANMDLEEDLKVEYRLSQRFMMDRDFYEGVSAVLVRKDFSPHWNPSEVDEVSEDKIEAYFDKLEKDRELVLPKPW